MSVHYPSHKGSRTIEQSAFSGGKSSRLFPCHWLVFMSHDLPLTTVSCACSIVLWVKVDVCFLSLWWVLVKETFLSRNGSYCLTCWQDLFVIMVHQAAAQLCSRGLKTQGINSVLFMSTWDRGCLFFAQLSQWMFRKYRLLSAPASRPHSCLASSHLSSSSSPCLGLKVCILADADMFFFSKAGTF